MKILYIMPFKINYKDWYRTGDTNMSSKILQLVTVNKDLEVDLVGNFVDEDGNDYTNIVKERYGVKECIDLSSIASKRTYIKSGFELLNSMNIWGNYDLINIHNSNPSIVSKIVTYLSDYRVVFTLHAPPENMTFQYYHKEQYLNLLNEPTKYLMCVSDSHVNRCLNALNYYKEVPDGKPSIGGIVNGIEECKYVSNEGIIYDCGTIGRFSASKNVLESLKCVEAITRYTGGKGFLVGTVSNYEGSSEKEKQYIDEIMEVLDNNPQITWFKSLPSEEVRELLGKSKTYIALSTIETFGLTVCEAIMQGTPSIGFNINGIGEIIDEGLTGYKFQDKKRVKWSDRYEEVLSLYDKCLTLDRDSVRERARQRFSINRVASEYYEFYKWFGGNTNEQA